MRIDLKAIERRMDMDRVAQKQHDDAVARFEATMKAHAACYQPRRAVSREFNVAPRPHPSDAGRRPFRTNLPVLGQRPYGT